MSVVNLQIVMHGLIALVPVNSTDGVNHMTALLVDARQPPAAMTEPYRECFVEHLPQIEFPTESNQCRSELTGCIHNGSLCTCPLAGHEILIEPGKEPVKQKLASEPPRHLPLDREASIDFGYLANLSYLPDLPTPQKTLNREFLSSDPPRALVSRLTFPFDSLLPCDFSSRHEEGADNVHPLGFRPIRRVEQRGELSQAVAQQFVATVALDAAAAAPILRLRPFAGGPERTFRLKQAPPPPGEEPRPIRISLTNARPMFHHPDVPCDDGVARDFAFFFELVQDPPPWDERPIPHLKYTVWKSAADIEPRACDDAKAPMDRPICPMASLTVAPPAP